MYKRQFLILLLVLLPLFAQGEDCPFCAEKIQNQQVYQGNYWRVIVDYKPLLPGHLLIIPMAHRLTIHELTREEHAELFDIEKKVHCALQERYGPAIEDFQYEKNGPTLQSVNHLHIHVLPIEKAKMNSWWDKFWFTSRMLVGAPKRLSDEELTHEKQLYQKAFAHCL